MNYINDLDTIQRIIYNRSSVREYLDKKLTDEQITLLLKVGMAAPSACNLQPWEFIVINDEKILNEIKNVTVIGNYNTPLAIAVCGNTKNIPWEDEDWKIDCSCAVTNMMLTATAMGLGSVFIGGFDEEKVRNILEIPDNIKLMNLVYVGYPKKLSKPKTYYNSEAVCFNKYSINSNRKMRTMEMLGK